jgi:hypothetical protein
MNPVHILKLCNFDVHFNPLAFHLRLGCPVVVVVVAVVAVAVVVEHRASTIFFIINIK